MKKFLSSISFFFIFAAAFYVCMIVLWGETEPFEANLNYKLKGSGHTFSRLKDAKNTKNIDLLFLGSSHTFRGLDNRIFNEEGYSSFNLGSNSQTPLQTLFLLNRYLDQLDPKIVIFEVCPLVFSLDGVESSLELISKVRLDIDTFNMITKQKNLVLYNTFIFALYRHLTYSDLMVYDEPQSSGKDNYIRGGFVETELRYYSKFEFQRNTWEIPPIQRESFDTILNLLKSKNISYILFQAPVTKDYYHSFVNNEAFDKKMSKNGLYINFNESLTLNDSLHFFDYHHLNKSGIEIFNLEMIKLLKEKYH